MDTQPDILEEVITEKQTTTGKRYDLIIYNDDVNTFEHVINMLIEICEQTSEQAEQCAVIIHFKGKCGVRSGSYQDLKPRCEKLLEAGLSAKIE